MNLSNQQIARILGVPEARVEQNWGKIDQCLSALCGAAESPTAYTDKVKFAALATVRVECPPFLPIHEYGTDALHEKLYGHRKDLGDVNDGDGAKFAGRGFIQITGELNYKHYGDLLGVDLVTHPDEALEADVAATIFAAYFHDRHCVEAANASDWVKVRKLVNGGHNGLTSFLLVIIALALEAGDTGVAATAQAQLKTFEE